MPTPHSPPAPDRGYPHTPRPDGSLHIGAGIGAVLLIVLCCAAPALIVSGALAGLGAWLANPWVIAAAVLLAIGTTAFMLRRRAHRADCCPPPDSTDQDRPTVQATRQRRPNDGHR